MAKKTITINATMLSPTQVSVLSGKDQRTYPTIETFLDWLRTTHQRVLDAGGVLQITTGHGARQYQHPADLALRDAIGESSAGACLH